MNSCENPETTACSVYLLRAYFGAAKAEISNNKKKKCLNPNYFKYNNETLANIPFLLDSKLYLHSSKAH